MLQKIKDTLKDTKVLYDSTKRNAAELQILSAISNKSFSDKEIVTFIESQIKNKKVTFESIIETAKLESKKANRQLKKFTNMNEYKTFEKNNECGKLWIDEDNKINVYVY